jgi:hypothetical protein
VGSNPAGRARLLKGLQVDASPFLLVLTFRAFASVVLFYTLLDALMTSACFKNTSSIGSVVACATKHAESTAGAGAGEEYERNFLEAKQR